MLFADWRIAFILCARLASDVPQLIPNGPEKKNERENMKKHKSQKTLNRQVERTEKSLNR